MAERPRPSNWPGPPGWAAIECVAIATMADRGAAELDEHGRVIGTGGLSLVPTRHELVLDGVPLYTWCAYDVLGIPAAGGVDAVARSRCAYCVRAIEVTFRAGVPHDAPAAVTWFPRSPATNARRDFCHVSNLFCSPGHLDAWRARAGDPPGDALTVAEVTERGRSNWAQDARWPTPPQPGAESLDPSADRTVP